MTIKPTILMMMLVSSFFLFGCGKSSNRNLDKVEKYLQERHGVDILDLGIGKKRNAGNLFDKINYYQGSYRTDELEPKKAVVAVVIDKNVFEVRVDDYYRQLVYLKTEKKIKEEAAKAGLPPFDLLIDGRNACERLDLNRANYSEDELQEEMFKAYTNHMYLRLNAPDFWANRLEYENFFIEIMKLLKKEKVKEGNLEIAFLDGSLSLSEMEGTDFNTLYSNAYEKWRWDFKENDLSLLDNNPEAVLKDLYVSEGGLLKKHFYVRNSTIPQDIKDGLKNQLAERHGMEILEMSASPDDNTINVRYSTEALAYRKARATFFMNEGKSQQLIKDDYYVHLASLEADRKIENEPSNIPFWIYNVSRSSSSVWNKRLDWNKKNYSIDMLQEKMFPEADFQILVVATAPDIVENKLKYEKFHIEIMRRLKNQGIENGKMKFLFLKDKSELDRNENDFYDMYNHSTKKPLPDHILQKWESIHKNEWYDMVKERPDKVLKYGKIIEK